LVEWALQDFDFPALFGNIHDGCIELIPETAAGYGPQDHATMLLRTYVIEHLVG